MIRKRGRNNEGSIYLHKSSGLWCANLPIKNQAGITSIKREYCKRDANSQKAASALLLDMRGKSRDGFMREDKSMLISFLREWLELNKINIRLSTYIDYELTIRRYIAPHIGKIKLVDLDEMMLEQFYAVLAKAGVTPRQRKKAHALIHAALTRALQWRKVTRNVAAGISAPKYTPAKRVPLTDDQTKALIREAAKGKNLPLILLAIDTGMRQGELFGLRWSDVDLHAGELRVNRSLSEAGGTKAYNDPKTLAGLRSIELAQATLAALLAHRKTQLADGLSGSGLVFPSSTGKPLWKKSFHKNVWVPLLSAAGLAIHFHDLRHTAAVRMLERGLDPEVVREKLGHSSISVTLGTYAHVSAKQRRAAAATFDDMLAEN